MERNISFIEAWRVLPGSAYIQEAHVAFNGNHYICVVQDVQASKAESELGCAIMPPFVWLVRIQDKDNTRTWNFQSKYENTQVDAKCACLEAIVNFDAWLSEYKPDMRAVDSMNPVLEARVSEPIVRTRRIT